MRAYIDVSEDSVVGNVQPGGMFLLLLLFIVIIFILILIYVNVASFWKRVENMFYNIMGKLKYRSHHQIHTKMLQVKTEGNLFFRHLQQVDP